MYTVIALSYAVVNGAIRRDSHGMPTKAIVHDTLRQCQPRRNSLHGFGSGLTVIPAPFANNENPRVDPVGKKAHHETE